MTSESDSVVMAIAAEHTKILYMSSAAAANQNRERNKQEVKALTCALAQWPLALPPGSAEAPPPRSASPSSAAAAYPSGVGPQERRYQLATRAGRVGLSPEI